MAPPRTSFVIKFLRSNPLSRATFVDSDAAAIRRYILARDDFTFSPVFGSRIQNADSAVFFPLAIRSSPDERLPVGANRRENCAGNSNPQALCYTVAQLRVFPLVVPSPTERSRSTRQLHF
jgi:hypothetical protein